MERFSCATLRRQCMWLFAASALCMWGEPAKADYTRVNSVSRVTLGDVSTNCDFRLRLLAGSNANNTYRVTYVSQNAKVGYVLDATLTSTQGNEIAGSGSNLFMSPPQIGGTPPPGAPTFLRVTVPFAGGPGSAALVLNGQSFNLNPSGLDLEKQCATTSSITAEAGGGDGCAMLAGKGPDGSCRCMFDALSNNNPCRSLNVRRCFPSGSGAPGSTTFLTKCIGPVELEYQFLYVFNASTCACELCDPSVSVISADRASCSCKFSSIQEVMAPTPRGTPPRLQALKDSCLSLAGRNGYFNKNSCACEVCPPGKRANDTFSGCI